MNHDLYHTDFVSKVQHLFSTTSKEEILLRCFKNYRFGKGLNLTPEAYAFCCKEKLHTFFRFTKPKIFDSRHVIQLDELSKTPFFINTKYIYISDPEIVVDLSMLGDNFDDLIQMHSKYL